MWAMRLAMVSEMKRLRPLKLKLSLSYALFALALVTAISLFSNLFLKKQFEAYVINQLNKRMENTVSRIAEKYDAKTGTFGALVLDTICMEALKQGFIVRINDISGNVLWDARLHDSCLCDQMLDDVASYMQSHYRGFQGGYEEKNFPLFVSGVEVGSVNIGYYGPFYLDENDFAYLVSLNRALVCIGALALLTAVIIGLFMARRISHPIEQTINAAEGIADGNYKQKIHSDSSTYELEKLVTSINSLSNRLEDQDSLRKRLTYDIAHELRTPLTTLLGNIEALLDGVWEADEEHLQSCHEEILRLTRLVNDLEKLSQLENENTVLRKTEFDIRDLAQKIALSVEPECLQRHISISVRGDKKDIVADPDRLRQVLLNLVSNSLKYTGEGGHIVISIHDGEAKTTIEVEDDGSGIQKDHLPYIFDRFYRADASRSSKSGGAGIGLAIVKAIVQMHGGTITVQSEPESGTKFTIVLPSA